MATQRIPRQPDIEATKAVRYRVFPIPDIAASGPCPPNISMPIDIGLSFTQMLGLLTEQPMGVIASIAAIELAIPQTVGIDVSTRASGATQQSTDLGIGSSLVASIAADSHEQIPAAEVTQVTFDLNRLSGASAVSEIAVGGRTDWANDNNAIGKHDGSNATIAGNALGARGGQLILDYGPFTAKTYLVIDSVKLHFYTSQAGTVAGNGDFRHLWRRKTGDAWIILATHTGNVNFLTTPQTFDITASIGSWADIDSLQTGVYFDAALGEIQTAACDAVEIEIVAHLDFDPADVAGLAAWYRADRLNLPLADGTAIDTFPNAQATAGRDLSSSGTSRPLMKLNIINGKPVWRMDGTNDVAFQSWSPAWLTGTSGSVFAVCRPAVNKTHIVFAVVRSGVTTDRFFFYVTGTLAAVLLTATGGTNYIIGTAAGTVTAGNTYILEAHSNGSATEIVINGTTMPLTTFSGTNNGRWWGNLTSPNLVENGFWTDNATNKDFWNGDFAEVLLYDGVTLTAGEKDEIRSLYLADKYGITL